MSGAGGETLLSAWWRCQKNCQVLREKQGSAVQAKEVDAAIIQGVHSLHQQQRQQRQKGVVEPAGAGIAWKDLGGVQQGRCPLPQAAAGCSRLQQAAAAATHGASRAAGPTCTMSSSAAAGPSM